jgi:hypothetical protein
MSSQLTAMTEPRVTQVARAAHPLASGAQALELSVGWRDHQPIAMGAYSKPPRRGLRTTGSAIDDMRSMVTESDL